MSHHLPEHDPRSEFEDEGIPDLQDGTPEQQWAVDPQRAPAPGDEPMAVEDYGTTAEEQVEGEPLASRLGREEPDVGATAGADADAAGEAGSALGDSGAAGSAPDADAGVGEPGSLTPDSGLGVGSDLSTDFETSPGVDPEWPAQPEEPSGQVWEPPRPAGRLVAPDEGARTDAEPDEIAREAGPDAGGFSAEESAMRVEPEE